MSSPVTQAEGNTKDTLFHVYLDQAARQNVPLNLMKMSATKVIEKTRKNEKNEKEVRERERERPSKWHCCLYSL